jgi:acetyl-CoA carboxylase, biotin carboxylase subunit
MFESVLIANRGEIAVRIARTCRDLGIRVVAVYSTEDRDSPVVRMADQAICIGPAAAADSYLNLPAILEAARQSGAEAIHPGYGFLSEVPDFAESAAAAGHTFIGPPAAVIEQLGDKSAARAAMAKAGLRMVAGSIEPVPDAEAAAKVAADIGYPVIIKAVAGGGGRGMQAVHCPDELPSTFASVKATAQSLFKDDRVYLEQYLPSARHVEVQVLCDSYGNGVHIGQRDCSVQRRRQKIIEESPAPQLPADLATRMGRAALRGVLAEGYVGAGTVEFLVDASGCFYFMEVNCRIQVEHPVTELVYGIDLIREQLRIAAGEPLGYTQADLVPRGVALECRLNAEDPARAFMPTPGVLTDCTLPAGAFVRVDTDKAAGDRISAAYDPLLAKIAVWAPDRAQALVRMRRALAETRIAGAGICTNRDLLNTVLHHPAFVAGNHDTSFLDDLVSTEHQRV